MTQKVTDQQQRVEHALDILTGLDAEELGTLFAMLHPKALGALIKIAQSIHGNGNIQ